MFGGTSGVLAVTANLKPGVLAVTANLKQRSGDGRVQGNSVRFNVGDIVHNEITDETGRIVRIATGLRKPGYIVVTTNKVSGKELEALWGPRELREGRQLVRKFRTAVGGGS